MKLCLIGFRFEPVHQSRHGVTWDVGRNQCIAIPHRVDAYQKWWLDDSTSRVPSEAPVPSCPHPGILKNVQTPPQVNTLSFSQIYRVKDNRMVVGVGMSKRDANDVDNLADDSRPFKRRRAELPKSKMHWMKNLDHMVMGEFSRQRRRGGGSQVSKEQRKKKVHKWRMLHTALVPSVSDPVPHAVDPEELLGSGYESCAFTGRMIRFSRRLRV